MRSAIAVAALVVLAAVISTAEAAVPQTISYQGVLRDDLGAVVADGNYSMTFLLYSVPSGGTDIWRETKLVAVEDGIFNVRLGDVTPLTGLTFEDPYWLAMSVEAGSELSPRIPLASAPYALHADSVEPDVVSSIDGVSNDEGDIDLVAGTNITIMPDDASNTITFSAASGGDDGDWTISGADVYRASGNVGIGVAAPVHRLGVHSTSGLTASAQFTNGLTGSTASDGLLLGVAATSGDPYVMSQEPNSGLVLGAGGVNTMRVYPGSIVLDGYAVVNGTVFCDNFNMDVGAWDGYVLTSDASGNGTWEPPAAVPDGDWTISGGNIYRESGYVGIGTTTPVDELHVEGSVLVPYSGVYHVGDVLYKGLWWNSSTGSIALGDDTQSLEIHAGAALARVTVEDDGDVGVGTAVPEARLEVETDSGDAFKSECTYSAATDYIAVAGRSVPTDWYGIGADFEGGFMGVQGYVLPTGSQEYYAGYFAASGGAGTNYGAYAYANGTGTDYAIYGYAIGEGDYAGYFTGDVHATGAITSGALRSRIDHPLDPANMYLNHNAVESDEMKTVYDGTVELDADGSAWVEMPDWFDALNAELRYQLTCVGGYAPVYVAEEMRDNRFMIAGGTPGLKVCWQVTGVRRDRYAETQENPVEEMKPSDERGLYTHPAAHGLGRELSPDYRRRAEMEQKLSQAEDN